MAVTPPVGPIRCVITVGVIRPGSEARRFLTEPLGLAKEAVPLMPAGPIVAVLEPTPASSGASSSEPRVKATEPPFATQGPAGLVVRLGPAAVRQQVP